MGVVCRTVGTLSRAVPAGLLHGGDEERRVAQPGEVHLRRTARKFLSRVGEQAHCTSTYPRPRRHPPRRVGTKPTSPPGSYPGVRKVPTCRHPATSNYRAGTNAVAPTAATARWSPRPEGDAHREKVRCCPEGGHDGHDVQTSASSHHTNASTANPRRKLFGR